MTVRDEPEGENSNTACGRHKGSGCVHVTPGQTARWSQSAQKGYRYNGALRLHLDFQFHIALSSEDLPSFDAYDVYSLRELQNRAK